MIMRNRKDNKRRDEQGQFKPGRSGNPNGRPQGSRNRSALVAEQLLDEEAEKLIRKLVEVASEGDGF